MTKSKVILRRCAAYDPQRIARIIGEGMDELGVRPHGRTMVKPNGRSNLTTYAGPPPDPQLTDYCWGGCPGALFEAMQVIRVMQPEVFHEIKPLHIVFGHYAGAIDGKPGQRVLVMGDCARFSGQVCGRQVEIPSLYVRRESKDPHQARSADLLAKFAGVVANLIRHRGRQVIRVPGCPVSVAENVLYLSLVGKTQNPYLHPAIVLRFVWHYCVSRLVRLWRLGEV